MSETNITQILAALAAQKTEGNPASGPLGPPAQLHPGYQNNYAVTSPQTNTAPYSLPQPTSSGSVDLSNIKPSNTGSVNFEDAVSRARGIAADKRGSYDPGRSPPNRDLDSRSRGFRRSRSRSRSPPRYRDNYNPYRDERRDDGRRPNAGVYPRDRTQSPARLPMDQFQQRAYSTPDIQAFGGADPGIETITIDSSLVGLIIGRQGENLRRVETETGTRVQFMTGPEATGPHRLCKISGPRPARESAKNEINRIIEDNAAQKGPNALVTAPVMGKAAGSHQPALRIGEDTTQIMVPNRTVGLIIGRGGETIRDLQERSGCHVNIVGEEKAVNGLRPVNLIGTAPAARIAKDLIMEIVDSDNKTLASGGGPAAVMGGGPPAFGGPPMRGGGDMSGGDKINDTIMVPSDAVGMIIGKGGETIKDMQTVTGCKINVAQPSGADFEREIGLVGSRPAIEHAKRAILEKVQAVEEKNRSGGRPAQREQFNQYSQPEQQYRPQSGAPVGGGYGQPPQQQQYPQQQAGPQGGPQGAPAPGGEDPYSAYGGYQAYAAMWYAAMQQQQQGQPGPGPPPS